MEYLYCPACGKPKPQPGRCRGCGGGTQAVRMMPSQARQVRKAYQSRTNPPYLWANAEERQRTEEALFGPRET